MKGEGFEKAGETPTGEDSGGQEGGRHRKWKRGLTRNKQERDRKWKRTVLLLHEISILLDPSVGLYQVIQSFCCSVVAFELNPNIFRK